MKRIISILLTCFMLFQPVVGFASATEMSNTEFKYASPVVDSDETYEEFEYTDALGDRYHGVHTRDKEIAVVTIYDEDENIISKAEHKLNSDLIIETVYSNTYEDAAAVQNNAVKTRVVSISDLSSPISEEDVALAASSIEITTPGSKSYTSNGWYNTDYTYLGQILRGEAFYRYTGAVDSYQRVSHTFVRNTTIGVIALYLNARYSYITGSSVKVILGSIGITVVQSYITTDWNFYGYILAVEYQMKCEMEYNSRAVVMSVIEKDLEYFMVADDDGNLVSFYYDGFNGGTPQKAINLWCKEAVGYAGKAFNIKFIAGYDPSLQLPVKGPVY